MLKAKLPPNVQKHNQLSTDTTRRLSLLALMEMVRRPESVLALIRSILKLRLVETTNPAPQRLAHAMTVKGYSMASPLQALVRRVADTRAYYEIDELISSS